MIILAAFLLGAIAGWFRAGKLGGKRADRIQYAIGFGMAFMIIGLIITVVLSRYL